MVNITGNHDGSSAVDYTVNPATGFPWATGPRNLSVPFNHLLPAWDSITGTLAADRPAGRRAPPQPHRRGPAGRGSRCPTWRSRWSATSARSPRSRSRTASRKKDGNYLYGAFGRDFVTKEGRRIMIVALTLRQWHNLVEATGLHEAFATVEKLLRLDLTREGDRFAAREVLGAVLKPWTIARTLDEIREIFDAPRRVLGAVPDVHRAGGGGPALLGGEPAVRARSSSRASAPTSCPARRVELSAFERAAGAPGPAARRAHRRAAGRGARPVGRRDRPAPRRRGRGRPGGPCRRVGDRWCAHPCRWRGPGRRCPTMRNQFLLEEIPSRTVPRLRDGAGRRHAA